MILATKPPRLPPVRQAHNGAVKRLLAGLLIAFPVLAAADVYYQGDLWPLTTPGSIQKEFHLSADQLRRIGVLKAAFEKEVHDEGAKFEFADHPDWPALGLRFRELDKRYLVEADKILSPSQSGHLREVLYRGAFSLMRPDLQDLLSLTPEQRKRVDELSRLSVYTGKTPAELAKGKAAAEKAGHDMVALLTPSQRAEWERLRGPDAGPF